MLLFLGVILAATNRVVSNTNGCGGIIRITTLLDMDTTEMSSVFAPS